MWYTGSSLHLTLTTGNYTSYQPNFNQSAITGTDDFHAAIVWAYSYANIFGAPDLNNADNKLIYGKGQFDGVLHKQALPEGSMKLFIDTDGSYLYEFKNTSGVLIYSYTGNLSSIPQDFEIHFAQTSFGNGVYTTSGKQYNNYPAYSGNYIMLDNIKITTE